MANASWAWGPWRCEPRCEVPCEAQEGKGAEKIVPEVRQSLPETVDDDPPVPWVPAINVLPLATGAAVASKAPAVEGYDQVKEPADKLRGLAARQSRLRGLKPDRRGADDDDFNDPGSPTSRRLHFVRGQENSGHLADEARQPPPDTAVDDSLISTVPTTTMATPGAGLASKASPTEEQTRIPSDQSSKGNDQVKEPTDKPRGIPARQSSLRASPGMKTTQRTLSNLVLPDRRGADDDDFNDIGATAGRKLHCVQETEENSGHLAAGHQDGMRSAASAEMKASPSHSRSAPRRRLSISSALQYFGLKSEKVGSNPSSGGDSTEALVSELFEFCLSICMMNAGACAAFVDGLSLEERSLLWKAAKLAPSSDGVVTLRIPGQPSSGQAVIWNELVHSYLTRAKNAIINKSGDRRFDSGGSAGQEVTDDLVGGSSGKHLDLVGGSSGKHLDLVGGSSGKHLDIVGGSSGRHIGHLPRSDTGASNIGASRTSHAHLPRSDTGASNFSFTSCTDFNWRSAAAKSQPSFFDFTLNQLLTANVLTSSNVRQHAFHIRSSSGGALDSSDGSMSEAAMTYCSAMDQRLWMSDTEDAKQVVSLDGFTTAGGGKMEFKTSCLKTLNEWQRFMLKQQKNELESLSTKLRSVEDDHAVEHEVQEEQRELLRGFRKVITREAYGERRPPVAIYIVEEDPVLRNELVQLCNMADFQCEAYSSLNDALQPIMAPVLLESTSPGASSSMLLGGAGSDSEDRLRPPAVDHTGSVKSGVSAGVSGRSLSAMKSDGSNWRFSPSLKRTGSTSTTGAAEIAKVVFLNQAVLRQQLPPEWRTEGCFVVLTTHSDELDAVGSMLLAADEVEIRDQLRKRGIQEYLLHPVSLGALQKTIDEATRRRFGDEYLLSKALGRGGSGVVYKAMRLRDGEVFALKEINTRRLSRKAQRQVESELQILRELSWPTVVFLVDAWVSKDRLQYLLMPLLEGGSLMQLLEPEVLNGNVHHTDSVMDWYVQTVHGVNYLHWRGMVHRDIKPGNLLLAGDKRTLQIGDLGSAAFLPGNGPHPGRSSFLTGGVCTPLYSSPETLLEDRQYAVSDVWAIGVTFFEVYTTHSMFPPDSSLEAIKDLAANFDISNPGMNPDRNLGGRVMQALRERAQRTSDADRHTGEPFARELLELVVTNPMRRPTASDIASRGDSLRRIEKVLARVALPDERVRKQHLHAYRSILQESHAAARS